MMNEWGMLCSEKSVTLGRTRFKNLFLMKVPSVYLILFCVLVQANAFTQGITLSLSNTPMREAFTAIKQQTGIHFLYTEDLIKEARPLSFSLANATLSTALERCFRDQPLSYKLVNHTVVVQLKTGHQRLNDTAITITGTVKSAEFTLAGVSISIRGTSKGTTTDKSGAFELYGVHPNTVLVITAIGYQTYELTVRDKIKLDIILYPAASTLDETLIIGYGTTTKRINTGSSSHVKGADIGKQPINNALEALQGRVPGLFITQNSGLPGSSFTVQLRGQNSIGSGNDPLYIIDQVPFISGTLIQSGTIINQGSPLNSINPSDIESIDILKDADATAIYGSRGANGVILITTKSGKTGKTKVNLNTYAGVGQITRKLKLLNTSQYLEMRREAFTNDGASPDPGIDFDLTKWDTSVNKDWQDRLLGNTAQLFNSQISISGGNKQTQFLFGGGYNKQTTVFPGNFNDQKGSFHLKINTLSDNEKFRSMVSVNYLGERNYLPQTDLTSVALLLPPNAPEGYDISGKLNWADNTWTNPYSYLGQTYLNLTTNLITNAQFSYQLLPQLKLKLSTGYNKIFVEETAATPLSSLNPYTAGSIAATSFSNNKVSSVIAEPQIEFNTKTGKSKIDILAGGTIQASVKEGSNILAYGYNNDALINDIKSAPHLTVLNNNYTKYHYAAVFGRINYRYAEKYLLNLSGRRDASSRFGPGKQYANFGAAGMAWIFSEEKWIKPATALSFGKLRLSYGTTGNDQISDYGFLDTWRPTLYPYLGTSGLFSGNLVNPNYAWEINKKAEAGLDLGFFENRIYISAAFYSNRSGNQLVGYPLPAITGYTSVNGNLPALVRNTGLELELMATTVQQKHLRWTSTFNISFPRNKLLAYPNIEQSSYTSIYVVGKSLFILPRLHISGVDPVTGMYVFEDKDGNGSGLDYPQDLQALKEVTQKYHGGFLNTVSFDHWQLDVLIQFVKQTGLNYLANSTSTPGMAFNQPVQVLNRWEKPGDLRPVQKFTQEYGDAFLNYIYAASLSDQTISDASYLRLKNISLSYQLPDKWKKGWAQQARIYFQGQNLLTLTQYPGMDPENNAASRLPPLRIITVGFQLTFN